MRTRGRRGSSGANVRTFCCRKLQIFQNLWCVRSPHGQEGREVELVQRFFGQSGWGSIFRDFVDVFYGRSLIHKAQSLNEFK